jgi:hypothetical protein
MLIGNHDHHYFPEVGYTGTSGYQHGGAAAIGQFLDENREHFQMAYLYDRAHYNILCTHAGVGHDWLFDQMGYEESKGSVSDFINDVWKYKPKACCFTPDGYDRYGDSKTQTPIWIRPIAFMKVN